MAVTSGSRLGPYEVVDLLGSGGMGEVYRARDPRQNREVAIKVLPEAIADRDRLRRFEQEARTAGALNHPSILAIYDVGEHEGVFLASRPSYTARASSICPPAPMSLTCVDAARR
jgi:serine/threonine protein kinase